MTDHVSSRLLRGLLYEPGRREQLQETRRGAPIYDGTPDMYEEYRFRVEGKLRAVSQAAEESVDYKHAELAGQLFGGLKEGALRVAMDMGHEEISANGGIEKLLKALERDIHTNREAEGDDFIS